MNHLPTLYTISDLDELKLYRHSSILVKSNSLFGVGQVY